MRFLILIVLFSAVLLPSDALAQVYKVVRVIDGDTIVLTDGTGQQKVDLIGIDAPETNKRSPKIQREKRRTGKPVRVLMRMGRKSKQFLEDLIVGKEVVIELGQDHGDVTAERWNAYVYVRGMYWSEEDKKVHTARYKSWQAESIPTLFLNYHVVRMGYAEPDPQPPNVKFSEAIDKAYSLALEEERGLWYKDKGKELEDQAWVKKSIRRVLEQAGIRKPIMKYYMDTEEMEMNPLLVTYRVCFEGRDNCRFVHYDYERWFLGEKTALDTVACTEDAKQCPDGTFVGRVPPDCEFAQCP